MITKYNIMIRDADLTESFAVKTAAPMHGVTRAVISLTITEIHRKSLPHERFPSERRVKRVNFCSRTAIINSEHENLKNDKDFRMLERDKRGHAKLYVFILTSVTFAVSVVRLSDVNSHATSISRNFVLFSLYKDILIKDMLIKTFSVRSAS